MKPLNPELYDRLKKTLYRVRISNDGLPALVHYAPNALREGRLQAHVVQWGESYSVSCPMCTDTRMRLCISHRWAVRDPKTGDDMLHLAFCFNEQCFANREAQKQLHAMVFPDGKYSCSVAEILKPPTRVSPAQAATQFQLPESTPLDELHAEHPAVRYVQSRGFSPITLAREYGVGYCDDCYTSRPKLREPRIVIPMFGVVSALPTATSPQRWRPQLAGWQARAISANLPEDRGKYLTAAGMHKNQILYGLPLAMKSPGPLVIVEGVTDAWKVGLNAVALLGKTISQEQCSLIVRHCGKRPVVVWLDDDAEKEIAEVRDRIRAARVAAGDRTAVVIAHTPAHRHDPGECTPDETSEVIAQAIGTARK